MLETTLTKDHVEKSVEGTIASVMTARDLDPNGITSLAKLSETLGLRSMDLALIVLTLEDDLSADPFQAIPITSIRTVEDLTHAYLVALGLAEGGLLGAQDMSAEMAAAKTRRARRRR